MIKDEFKSFVVREINGKFHGGIESKAIKDLPDNEVLVAVKYSSLNYKDALSAAGNKGVSKIYPHTPGIDAAGIVMSSKNKKFLKDDKVVITGHDLGMKISGGFEEFISVPADWAMKLPSNLTLKESMVLGTAGLTAALALYKLEKAGLNNSSGEILITGATGGVGSLAIMILSKAGYKNITAATGKLDKSKFLKKLGAKNIIERRKNEIDDKSGKPMLSGRWAGVIDSVGGNILATALKSTKYGGHVASCGLTQSFQLNTTVYPFILRSINLIGIDTAQCPMNIRKEVWKKLSGEWKINILNYDYEEISLEELQGKVNLMLQGKSVGRIILNLEK
jgi:acrylyl-CoA reductase (NADPH)